MSRRWLGLVLAAGLALRLASLDLPGTTDLDSFGVWLRGATRYGVAALYQQSARSVDGIVGTGAERAALDYPPGALYLLATAGHVSERLAGPPHSHGDAKRAVKLLILSFTALLAGLVGYGASRRRGAAAGRLAAALYWANPAVLLHGAVLGYVGVIAAVPAVGALLAAQAGRATLAGLLLGAAALTKPQGILVAPAVLVLLWPSLPNLRRLAISGSASFAMLAAPLVSAGAFTAAAGAVQRLLTDGMLSGQAANVWWLVSYGMAVAARIDTLGWAAFGERAAIVPLGALIVLPSHLAPGTGALVVAAAAWTPVVLAVAWASYWTRRRPDDAGTLLLAAFTVHAYFTFAVQAHENHLALALPLLCLAAALDPRLRGLMAGVSAFVLLNLLLFYGIGEDRWRPPAFIASVDLTVVLALANLALLAWHATVLRQRGTRAAGTPLLVPVGVMDIARFLGSFAGTGTWHQADGRSGTYQVTQSLVPAGDGFELAFVHQMDDGTVLDARFAMRRLTAELFRVEINDHPLGHGYVLGDALHYHLNTPKAYIEAGFRVTPDGLETLGSSSTNASGQFIAWRESLGRV